MTLISVIVFSLAGLLIGWFRPRRWSTDILLALSVFSIFWLQPLTPIRNLDFWLPTTSVGLTVVVWAITYPGKNRDFKKASPGLAILFLTILAIAAMRYLGPLCCLTPSKPPPMHSVVYLAGIVIILGLTIYKLFHGRRLAILGIIGLIALFMILKTEQLSLWASQWLRSLFGQPPEMADSTDLSWVGFSFIAFRLLHVCLDRLANRLPEYSLSQFAVFTLFFPAFLAGPIDRIQHFIQELHKGDDQQQSADWSRITTDDRIVGLKRILIGVFKKIALADSLAIIALNSQNAAQVNTGYWLWVMLLAYSLRIYLDFSGYTDIAVGVAKLIGINLPENFNKPYLKTNLTLFWNSWHITLAQWFRSYIFFPVTRALRLRHKSCPPWLIILIGQVLTMGLIGIWHGITWNFLIWGIWHGAGLFIQNRWSDWQRSRLEAYAQRSAFRLAFQVGGWFATFTFVSLGWVWFALPTPASALAVFSKLIEVGV